MNRQLKFRVWDNKLNIFSTPEDNDAREFFIHFGGYRMIRCCDGYSQPTILWDDEIKNRYSIQQWTGLTDKNGVEVYEGDILKCKGFDGWFDTVGFYYNVTVKYNTVESGDSHIAGFAYIPMDREVIGNIFENSELLK